MAETGLAIRCGIHVGDVDQREGDVSGIAVNVAARVMTLAPNGETLLTTSAAQSAIGCGHHVEVFGTFELNGIDGQWLLHQVAEEVPS